MKTLNTLKEWMANQYDAKELKDIVEHGMSQRRTSMIYYHETLPLYDRYHKDIWELLNYEADSQFHGSMGKMLNLLEAECNISNDATFKNSIIMFAAETIARQLTDHLEEGEE